MKTEEIAKVELSESQMDLLKSSDWISINEINFCKEKRVNELIEKYYTKQLKSLLEEILRVEVVSVSDIRKAFDKVLNQKQ